MDLLHYDSSDTDHDSSKHASKKSRLDKEYRNETNPTIKLLSSPQEINLYPKHSFKRNQPHIHGNWAGSLYISLKPVSGIKGAVTVFDNRIPFKRLRRFACTTIKQFYSNTVQVQLEKECEDDIVIVPHFKLDEGKSDSSDTESSDDDSDDDDDNNVKNGDKNMKKSNENEEYSVGLHISLAKPFYLQKQSIKPFLSDLEKRLSIIQPLYIQFNINSMDGIEILVNDNKTRSFLTVSVWDKYENQLKGLISAIDTIMIKYGLESYYTNPKFH